jgi:DNA-directed RNA polymerase subunit omega
MGPLMEKEDRLIHPRIDRLLEHADSHYAAVIVAAKRARQINNYWHTLGDQGAFEEYAPPMVETPSKNYLTIALEEVAQGKIAYRYRA